MHRPVTGTRRTLLKSGLAGAAAIAVGPGFAQARTKVKVGYLHTLAVDGQIWTGQHTGAWDRQGLDLELIPFTTGLEIFQAMIGGSIDVLSTGAVLSNFPARGQGKAFLINNIEYATAQLWVRDPKIAGLADLKGRKISTTVGTTAHVFLDRALRAGGLDPTKDVQLVNQRMSEAVTSFISGAVDAVALWVPFDVTVRSKVSDARKLVDASAYFPQAAIVGGWAAGNDFHAKNPAAIDKLVRGWVDANDHLLGNIDATLAVVQKNHYPQVPLPDLKEQFKASRYYTSKEWRQRYADGTVTGWLQQVTDFFVTTAKIANPVPASTYFDPKPFLAAVKA
jgi:NitT/TauT family transport system substrate-binding protein